MEFASEDRINMSVQILAEQNIPHKTSPIEPISLTPSIFHDRIPSIALETSHYLFFRLQLNQWLNAHNYLMYNPRRKQVWKDFLFPNANDQSRREGIQHNLNRHQREICDFLNTIYGEHEISYERSFESFKWLLELYHLPTNQNEAPGWSKLFFPVCNRVFHC